MNCNGLLRPPIKMCTKGHNLCRACGLRRKVNCIVCQSSFAGTNELLGKIVHDLHGLSRSLPKRFAKLGKKSLLKPLYALRNIYALNIVDELVRLRCRICGEESTETSCFYFLDSMLCPKHTHKRGKTETRNTAIENIIRAMVFVCPYKQYGCNRLLDFKVNSDHRGKCTYRPRDIFNVAEPEQN